VTHDQAEAMTLGDRIAVLKAGRLEQLDTPRRIYEHPASSFVAGFFGSPPMNLVQVERDGQHAQLGPLRLRAPKAPAPKLLLGVRPEHVRIEREGPSSFRDPGIATSGRIVSVEPLGAETHVEVDVSGRLLRARIAGLDAPNRGEEVVVRMDESNLRWFDRETGLAL
jgi:sn-glycerol 3-phosphate transport system ATP-binding protein